jgi:hypothetical protein
MAVNLLITIVSYIFILIAKKQQDFLILLIISMIPICYINIKQFLLVKKIISYDVEINSVFIHRNKKGVVLELNNDNVVKKKIKLCAMIKKRKKIKIRFGDKINNNSYDFVFLKNYVKLNYDLLSNIVVLLHFIFPKKNFLPICQIFENLSLCCITTNIVINVIIGNSNFFCYIIMLVITASFLIFYIHEQIILSLPTKNSRDDINSCQGKHSTISSIRNKSNYNVKDINNSLLSENQYSSKTLPLVNVRLLSDTKGDIRRWGKINKAIINSLHKSEVAVEKKKKGNNEKKDEKNKK